MDYIHPKLVNSLALPMDVIPNGKWFISTYLFNLVELVKTFPLIYGFLQQRWMCVDIPCNKGSHTRSKALNQQTSLRIVIAVFNMEQEAMRAQIDSW